MADKPSIESTSEPLTGLYTLYFRDGKMNSMQSKNFRHHGGLKEAIARGQRHCEVMQLRFSFVQPLISDLYVEESFHLGRGISA